MQGTFSETKIGGKERIREPEDKGHGETEMGRDEGRGLRSNGMHPFVFWRVGPSAMGRDALEVHSNHNPEWVPQTTKSLAFCHNQGLKCYDSF
jgi:hypothetical protein